MESIHHQTILGIDPGTRFMGLAVLRDDRLLHYAVRTLRNGQKPYDLIGQARRGVLATIRDFRPQIVAIEEPLLIPTKRSALVSAVAQELRGRAEELGLAVREIAVRTVRELIAGNAIATKIDVAEALVAAGGFVELRPLLPMRPTRAVLGISDRSKYWLHAFDALALCRAAQLVIPGQVDQ